MSRYQRGLMSGWLAASATALDSRLTIFEGVDMFLRHATDDENVSCEL